MSAEDRITRVESAFVMLSELVQNHGERFDTHREWLNKLGARMDELAAAQANTEQKLAALVDAQIHTEQQFARLAEAQARTEDELRRLSEAQARSDQRVDRLADRMNSLADMVERVIGGGGGGEGL